MGKCDCGQIREFKPGVTIVHADGRREHAGPGDIVRYSGPIPDVIPDQEVFRALDRLVLATLLKYPGSPERICIRREDADELKGKTVTGTTHVTTWRVEHIGEGK